MEKPILSICIATYNRADFIGETLDSIIPQLDEDVELLIVDGASTDGTEALVQEYAAKCARLRYVRLPNKGGVDQDYNRSVELASGEFCWLFTDDDILRLGAVAAVKSAVKQGHDLIIVNAELRDLNLTTIVQHQRIVMKHDRVYHAGSLDPILKDAAYCLSFIGSVVIRRSLWMSRNRTPYFGTEFIHMGVIFQDLLAGSTLILADTHIIIRLGNSHWMPRAFDIWMFKWPRLIWSFKDISDDVKRGVTQREPWRNLKNLVFHRSLGGYDRAAYLKYFANLDLKISWKFWAYLIACFPRFILTPVHSGYSFIKRQFHYMAFSMR